MKQKPLLILAGLAVVLVLLGMFTVRQQQPTDTLAEVRQPVFPDLKQTLADVQGVTIRAGGDTVILEAKQQDGDWVAANKGGFVLQTAKLRELLEALAEAQFQEAKTSNPQQYHHLGLRDTQDADSEALRVTVERANLPALDILIGKKASGWNTSYARLLSDPQSWVLDREISIDREPVDWIERQVIDVDLERVQSVTHTAPDGEKLLISKASPDQPLFDVADIPAGHVLTYEAVPEVIADVIDNLRLEDVRPATGLDWDEENTYHAVFQTFDGMEVRSRALQHDDEHYVAFTVAYDPALRWQPPAPASDEAAASDQATATDEAAATDQSDAPAGESSSDDTAAVSGEVADEAVDPALATGLRDAEEVQAEVAALQKKLSGWAFRIPEYRYKGFTKRIGEIVQSETEAEEAEGDTAGNEAAAASPG